MTIDAIIDNIFVVPTAAKEALRKYIIEVSYPKGHILLKAGKTESMIYFIKKGIVRAYSSNADNEITFWFGIEGEPVISMRSYVENKNGYEDIELLEECEFYALKTKDLQSLFESDISIANWGRRFAEKELIKTEERLISRQFKSASERYQELLRDRPDLLQRVQLGHIASYLGITQVSLSRIRAEIR